MDSSPPVDLPPETPVSVLETKSTNGPGSVSDEEGFLSGEEDFHFASESPVAPSSDDPFAASTDISLPTAEGVAFSEVMAEDEEKDGEKVLEEDGLGSMKGQSNGFHDSGASGSVVGDIRQLKGSGRGFEGVGDSKVSLVDNGENLERNREKVDEVAEFSKEPDNVGVVEPDVVVVDGVKLTPEGDSVVDAIDAEVKVPGIAVVGTTANLEPAKLEREPSVGVPVIATDNTDETNQEELKSVEPDVVIVDGVKLTPEGDSIVDVIDADVKAPGIAVVGKAADLEPAKLEREPSVDVPAIATENTDDTNQEELKPVEPDVVIGDGLKLTPEGDSVVDAIDADVKAPGIAVVGKAANLEPAIVERELPVDVPVAATDNTDETKQQEVKSVEPDVLEAGVKVTPEGDSIVDAIDIDVKVPGIAVVGTAANVELPKVEEEIPVNVPVVEPDNTDERNQDALKSVESDVVEVDGVRMTTAGDSVVDAIDADVKIPGIAAVGKNAESESAIVEEFPVDDPFSPLAGVDEDAVASKISGVGDLCLKHDIEDDDQKPLNSISAAAAEAGNDKKLDIKGDLHSSSIVHDIETVVTKDIEKTPEVQIKEMAASEAIEAKTSNKFENDKDLDGNENLGDTNPVRAENSYEDSGLIVQGGDSEPDTENQVNEEADLHGSVSDGETDGMIFGSSEAARQFIEQLEQGSGSEISQHHLQGMDGQVVTDSDEEVDTDDEGESKELLDPSALAALLKAATGADADEGGGITITSQDGTRLFSVERPAGLGSSLRALRPNPRQSPLNNLFAPTTTTDSVDSEITLSDEEKKTFEKLQHVRVKYLRLIHRLGLSPDDSVPAQVLYRLMLIMGRQGGRAYTMDAAKSMALQLEAEEGNDLDLSVNILVLGKCGVGKSATINSIFGKEKAHIDAFQPATDGVREIVGYVNGVKLRVFDTPGLKCSVYEQSFNRGILSSVKRATKKHPLDIVLYVDRMDSQTRDMNDVPLLKTISSYLGSSIWKMTIITLTHAGSAPPDGPSGSPLSYDVFATQRSHVLQQTVSSAAGEIRMLNPSLMHPVSLVENHPSCRKNREGQKVLPNGLSWRPQLLLLCYSLKILAEVNSISKPQDAFDHRKIFGFRGRSPPLPYMLSSMLQSRAHPKLPNEQGGDNGDSDIDLDYFSDPDQDEEDEYDQLPPFKPLKKTQVAKLSKEQRRAYFEEYDYRVKLLQKKQLKDELQRMKEMKNKGKDATFDYGYMEEDADSGAAAPVAVPLPDMVLPPSFDADNPAYRYRFLEPTSQFLARPVLDTHGWDHDCGYDGVNLEQGLAIANRFPAAVTFQITKDKKDFTVSLDSSVSAKHGENGSSMAGLDIQSLGKQLAYTLRGETKFKILKKNKTSGGISVTFLGDNIVSGAKLEDQITIGKQYVLVGSAGTVRSDRDTAYGANFELQRREADFPIGQAQSTFSMSLIKWRGDLALGVNSLFQFSVGRGSKVAIRAGLNNKLSGQITVKTSSSEHLSLALTALIPIAASIYKKLQPSAPEQYALY